MICRIWIQLPAIRIRLTSQWGSQTCQWQSSMTTSKSRSSTGSSRWSPSRNLSFQKTWIHQRTQQIRGISNVASVWDDHVIRIKIFCCRKRAAVARIQKTYFKVWAISVRNSLRIRSFGTTIIKASGSFPLNAKVHSIYRPSAKSFQTRNCKKECKSWWKPPTRTFKNLHMTRPSRSICLTAANVTKKMTWAPWNFRTTITWKSTASLNPTSKWSMRKCHRRHRVWVPRFLQRGGRSRQRSMTSTLWSSRTPRRATSRTHSASLDHFPQSNSNNNSGWCWNPWLLSLRRNHNQCVAPHRSGRRLCQSLLVKAGEEWI